MDSAMMTVVVVVVVVDVGRVVMLKKVAVSSLLNSFVFFAPYSLILCILPAGKSLFDLFSVLFRKKLKTNCTSNIDQGRYI